MKVIYMHVYSTRLQLCSNFYLHNTNPHKRWYHITGKLRRLDFQSFKLREEYHNNINNQLDAIMTVY